MKAFNDQLNTAVFTTKYILNKESAIVFVFHGEDGYWEFYGPESNLSDDEYRIVALKEIIAIDRSVLQVADLPYNYKAIRKNQNSPWIIEIGDV